MSGERVEYVVLDYNGRDLGGSCKSADEALRLAEALVTQNGFKHRAPFTCYRRVETPVFRVKRDGGYGTITEAPINAE